jgi:hypothetical protein
MVVGLVHVPQGVGAQLRRRPAQGDVLTVQNWYELHHVLEGNLGDIFLVFEGALVVVSNGHSQEVLALFGVFLH